MFAKLMKDESGFVVSSELVLLATMLVLGLIVGLSAVRQAISQELADLATAIGRISQDYSYSGITGHSASVAGSIFTDNNDFCEVDADVGAGATNACMTVTQAPTVNAE
jgi:Flp pilus assembly pilin Flp